MKAQESSTIHLPIKLSKQEIEWTINQLVPGVVYEDTSMDKDGMMVVAKKIGTIRIAIDPNTFRYRVSLDIWIKKDIGLGIVEAQGVIAVDFSTSYEIRKDWQIRTLTEVSDHKWLEMPKVSVGFFIIPIKSIANKILERSKALISRSLDHQLANSFNLRNYIQEGWNLLQQPIQVSEEYSFWLKIYPEYISLFPISIADDKIIGKVVLKAGTNAFIGEKPTSDSTVILPPFEYSKIKEEGFKIQLPIQIPYEEVQKIGRQQLINKNFTSGRRSVTVTGLTLRGEKDQLVMNVSLTGSFNGSIIMTGHPVYNKINNRIEFETIDFEIETSNMLMQGMVWLFQKRWKRKFEKAMKFPLSESLEKIKAQIQDSFQKYIITDNIILSGHLEDIEVERIELSEKSFEVLFLSKGRASLEISSIPLTAEINQDAGRL